MYQYIPAGILYLLKGETCHRTSLNVLLVSFVVTETLRFRLLPDLFYWSLAYECTRDSLMKTGTEVAEKNIYILHFSGGSVIPLLFFSILPSGANSARLSTVKMKGFISL